MKYRLFKLALGIAAVLALSGALAQQYPSKPVRMIVAFPPGGGVDLTGRVLAKKLGEIWGQPVVVENKPGATATIGANAVVLGGEDGYTLLVTNNALAISAGLYATLPYDPLKDLKPISTVLATPFVLVVPADAKAANLGEFLQAVKAKPGNVSYASTGIGSGPHLAMIVLMQMSGISMNHVPYKGGGQAIPDVIAGRVQAFLTTPLAAMPHVQAGKLRALGVTSAERMKEFPAIPTIAEAGVPGYDVQTWYMVLAAGKAPDAVVRKVHDDIVTALKDPAVQKPLQGDGATLIGSTPAQARELLARDLERWKKVITQAGVKPTD